MRSLPFLAALLAATVAAPHDATAQTPTEAQPSGAPPGRPIALFGLRLGSTRARLGSVGVEYVAQLIPAAFAYDNPVAPLSTSCPQVQSGNLRGRARLGYCRRRVYGAGAMPLGVQVNAPISSWLHAFAAGSAGALLFSENMPVPQARRFNLAFDFGGGLELGGRRRGALTLGYKLHHLSNAWTATANPGIDHHVFYLGFVHRVGSGRELRRTPVTTAADGAAERQ